MTVTAHLYSRAYIWHQSQGKHPSVATRYSPSFGRVVSCMSGTHYTAGPYIIAPKSRCPLQAITVLEDTPRFVTLNNQFKSLSTCFKHSGHVTKSVKALLVGKRGKPPSFSLAEGPAGAQVHRWYLWSFSSWFTLSSHGNPRWLKLFLFLFFFFLTGIDCPKKKPNVQSVFQNFICSWR